MAPPKRSLVWTLFKEYEEDFSSANCQVPGCKAIRVSRGKSGRPRKDMTSTALEKHLEKHHPIQYKEFIKLKEDDGKDKREREDIPD